MLSSMMSVFHDKAARNLNLLPMCPHDSLFFINWVITQSKSPVITSI